MPDAATTQCCRACGAALAHVFVDLGMSPISNAMRRPQDVREPEPFYILRTFVCSDCKLVQIEDVQPAAAPFEGVVVGEGSVISMGVFIGASTKIVDRNTGEIHIGKVPPYSVVVSGSLPGKPLPNGNPGPNLYCAVIVKTVDAQTRSKTGINELLRD